MGAMGLLLALSTGNIYREVTLTNNQQIISSLIDRQLIQLSNTLSNEMRDLAYSLQSEDEFSSTIKTRSHAIIQQQLFKQFQRQFAEDGIVKLTGISILDLDYSPIATSINDRTNPDRDIACTRLVTEATKRSAIESTKLMSQYCNHNQITYFAQIVPVGGLRPYSFLYLESDPIPAFKPLENKIGIPIKILSTDNKVMYESDDWTSSDQDYEIIELTHNLSADPLSPELKIKTKTDSNLLTQKLEETRNSVMAIAVAITLIATLLMSLGARLTIVNPLRTLANQLKLVRKDKNQLGAEVDVSGNAEVNLLANEFNSLTVELRDTYSELEVLAAKECASNNAKSVFLANMSHELRTPLTAIIGFSEILQQKKLSEDETKKLTNTIVKNSNHLLQIINDILDLSKIDENKLEIVKSDFALYLLLQDVYSLVEKSITDKKVAFEIKYHYPLPMLINTDEMRVKQILINLLGNAKKFTDNGHIYLHIKYSQDNRIVFCVEDTGIGLDQEQQIKIFEAFTQANSSTTKNYGGTGLGLSISQRLSELLGGTLTVESEPGIGSKFSFSIDPGTKENLVMCKGLDQFQTKELFANHTYTNTKVSGDILLVEDTIDNQDLISSLLSDIGANVSIASNGLEAVSYCQNNKYDLVLMDMQMPVMGGLEAVIELRKLKYSDPIVMLTANTFGSDKEKCLSAGCNDFLYKPIVVDALYNIVIKYLLNATDHSKIDAVEIQDTKSFSTALPQTNNMLFSSLMGKSDRYDEIIYRFITKIPDLLQDISNSYNENDLENLSVYIHNLKGLGGNMGYSQITDLCTTIESIISNNETNKIQFQLDRLTILYDMILAGIDYYQIQNKKSN